MSVRDDGFDIKAADAAAAVRNAFDAAYEAADAQETRQRLEGLTRALPVAAITPEPEDPAVEAVRTLVRERDQAVASWRSAEARYEMMVRTRDEDRRHVAAVCDALEAAAGTAPSSDPYQSWEDRLDRAVNALIHLANGLARA